jgi:hypothetical protein
MEGRQEIILKCAEVLSSKEWCHNLICHPNFQGVNYGENINKPLNNIYFFISCLSIEIRQRGKKKTLQTG